MTAWHPTQHSVDENVAHLCERLPRRDPEEIRLFVEEITALREWFDAVVVRDPIAAVAIATKIDDCMLRASGIPQREAAALQAKWDAQDLERDRCKEFARRMELVHYDNSQALRRIRNQPGLSARARNRLRIEQQRKGFAIAQAAQQAIKAELWRINQLGHPPMSHC